MMRVGFGPGWFVVLGMVACAGSDGAAGANGLSRVVVEPPGAHCPAGGQAIEIGLDANGSGQLDAEEVSGTSYVCNGTSVTTEVLAIAPGDPRCTHGGSAMRVNGGVEMVACNGAPGPQGDAGLPPPEPVLGQFATSQVVRGAVVTCASVATTASSVSCTGLEINGMDLRLSSTDVNAVCRGITGKGYSTANGLGTVTSPYVVADGTSWAIVTTGAVSPAQNVSCAK